VDYKFDVLIGDGKKKVTKMAVGGTNFVKTMDSMVGIS
jgi:hypothetical protein